jgi:hypothetical protein
MWEDIIFYLKLYLKKFSIFLKSWFKIGLLKLCYDYFQNTIAKMY